MKLLKDIHGIITEININRPKNFGFVKTQEGYDVYFSFDKIIGPNQNLQQGMNVLIDCQVYGNCKLSATKVRIIKSINPQPKSKKLFQRIEGYITSISINESKQYGFVKTSKGHEVYFSFDKTIGSNQNFQQGVDVLIDYVKHGNGRFSATKVTLIESSNISYLNLLSLFSFAKDIQDQKEINQSIQNKNQNQNQKDEQLIGQDSEIKRQMDENKQCTICLVNVKSHMFLPCGHYHFCEKCAQEVKKQNNPKCSICRQSIRDITKVYE